MHLLKKTLIPTFMFIFVFFTVCAFAQLSSLPPVINTLVNKDTGTSLILTTYDDASFGGSVGKKAYSGSVQIVDVDKSWPPRWYSAVPEYPYEEYRKDSLKGFFKLNLFIDVRIVGGYFSFYKLLSNPGLKDGPLINTKLAGYFLLNSSMNPIDTIKSNLAFRNLYFHDLAINKNGERLVNLRKDSYLDLRDYSGSASDSAVHCNIDYLQVLDSKNDIIYHWDPMAFIKPQLFNFQKALKERTFATKDARVIEWTRLTSAQWDYDDNIIYDMKNIGIGKISRKYGSVIWQINVGDLPIISGQDTIRWYNQHDFNFLYDNDSTATYSLYSNGQKAEGINSYVRSCGIVFEQNKKTLKVKLVKVIYPQRNYAGNGQGNISYHKNGSYVIAYGSFDESDTTNRTFFPNIEYGRNDTLYGLYNFPRHNACYKAHRLDGFPRPPRPQIVKKGDQLTAVGDMQDWTWYRLSGPNNTIVEKVGTSSTIIVSKGNNNYCVEGKYGMGYSVSRIISTKENEPY